MDGSAPPDDYETLAAYNAGANTTNWAAHNLCGGDCWTLAWGGHHRYYLVTDLNVSDLGGMPWAARSGFAITRKRRRGHRHGGVSPDLLPAFSVLFSRRR